MAVLAESCCAGGSVSPTALAMAGEATPALSPAINRPAASISGEKAQASSSSPPAAQSAARQAETLAPKRATSQGAAAVERQ